MVLNCTRIMFTEPTCSIPRGRKRDAENTTGLLLGVHRPDDGNVEVRERVNDVCPSVTAETTGKWYFTNLRTGFYFGYLQLF